MRFLAALVVAVFLVTLPGCKDDPTGPRLNSTVIFRADAGCPNGTVELTLDDVVKGQFAMFPNSTVQSFAVAEGNHTASARQIGGASIEWEQATFHVNANETFTLHMVCP